MTEASVRTAATEHDGDPLYHHVKRAEWGLAILAWERPTKRGYQFQDGELRVIKRGFYHLLATVDPRPHGADQLIAELKQKAGLDINISQSKVRHKDVGISFADQLNIFAIEYPNGFADEAWQTTIRGAGAKRRLTRHRQAAIDDASTALADERLEEALATHTCKNVVDDIAQLLRRTNLVKPKEVAVFPQITAGREAEYIGALRDLMVDEEAREARFNRFVNVHDHKGGWPLVTVLPALVEPEVYTCVHLATMRRQALVLEPTLAVSARPNGRVYERILTLVTRIRELLIEASLTPADLMDVFDFMNVTLRPSAQKLLGK